QPQPADRRRAMNREPELDGSILFSVTPTRREFPFQATAKGIHRILAAIAMLACHLRHEMIRWLALRSGSDGMMDAQEVLPIRLARRPVANAFKVGCAIGERIRAPGKEKNVLCGPQPEDGVAQFRDTKHDKAAACALHLAA